ncbi:iron transporter [Treponema sp.]|uniref:iron transporter n=1 Tax=Treponema sp. TaxID=166 RepID=UPI003890658C
MKKTMSLILAGAAMAFAFMGCNEKATSQANSSAAAEAVEEDEGGFVEHDIGDEQQAGFLAVNGVYFQAVDMKSGEGNTQKGADFTMHIEADIAAMENDLGFVVDQFVPGLTVDYEVIDQSSGNVAVKGTFMQMNASDGPHYGANINLNQAGTYTARFIIHSPAENNYFIHTDEDTKPGSDLQKYWPNDKPLSVEFKDWVFDGKKVQPEYN